MHRESRTPALLSRLARWWLPETTPPRLLLYFVATIIFVLAWALWGLFVGVPAARNAGLVICIVALSSAVLVTVFAMAMPNADRRLQKHHRRLLRASKVISVALVICSVVMAAMMIPWIYANGDVSIFGKIKLQPSTSDAIAITHQANEIVLDGENPYGQTNIIKAMEGFVTVTPTIMRQGAFADAYPSPTQEQIDNALAAAKANPDVVAEEFESTLSYPAGSFLLRTPTDALGIAPQWFYLLCVALIGFVIAWRAPARLRPVAIIGCAASMLVWNSHFGGGTDALYLLFILLGWTLRKRPWLAALFIGVACTCKQTAWFFVPFYLVLMLREAGWRKAAQSLAVIGVVFFLINSPFIVSDPKTWINCVLAPMIHPLFPYGIGPVSFAMLSHTPVPSVIFTALEAIALVVALVWYYKNCQRAPHTGLLLAIVPLFFAWRSLIAYFVSVPLVVFGAVLIEEYAKARTPQPAAVAGTLVSY